MLHAQQHAQHVDIRYLPVICFRLLVGGNKQRAFHTRVVEGGIEPAKRGDGFFNERAHIRLPADIGPDEQPVAPRLFDKANGFLAFRFAPAAHHDRRSADAHGRTGAPPARCAPAARRAGHPCAPAPSARARWHP